MSMRKCINNGMSPYLLSRTASQTSFYLLKQFIQKHRFLLYYLDTGNAWLFIASKKQHIYERLCRDVPVHLCFRYFSLSKFFVRIISVTMKSETNEKHHRE